MPHPLAIPPGSDANLDTAYWHDIDATDRPADTALADVESPWALAPAVTDDDPNSAYWDGLNQGPDAPCASSLPGDDPGYWRAYWRSIDAASWPADTALADVEAPWAATTIPDPGDPEPGYWEWLNQQAPHTTGNIGAEPDLVQMTHCGTIGLLRRDNHGTKCHRPPGEQVA